MILQGSKYNFQSLNDSVSYDKSCNSVGNLAHVHFAANVFSLPLKSEEHPHGIYSEQELYMVLAVIFTCIFFDLDPAKSFPLRLAAKAVTEQLGKLVEANVAAVNMTGWIAGIVDKLHQDHSALTDYGVHMVRRLLDSGLGTKEITWSQILPTAGAMVANQAQVVRVRSRDRLNQPLTHLVYAIARLLSFRRRKDAPARDKSSRKGGYP